MESARRRNKVVALPSESQSVWDFVQKYGNAAATVVLLGAAVYFIYRWRSNSADAAKAATASELSAARSYVLNLQKPDLERQQPQTLAMYRDQTASAANTAITTVINSGGDVAQRAGALIARGDLNWELANFPALPGAATQPALRYAEDASTLLGKAESAYQQVASDSEFSDQHEAIASAHLGLAAIAENRGDWAKAKAELQAVIDHKDDVPAAASVAQQQLTALPGLSMKIPLVAVAVAAKPSPVMGPKIPVGVAAPMSSMGKPSTRPATSPAK